MKYFEFLNYINEENELKYYIIIKKIKLNNKLNDIIFINKLFNDINKTETEIKKLKSIDIKNNKDSKSINDNIKKITYHIKEINSNIDENSFLELTDKDKNKSKNLFNKIKPLLNSIK